MWNPFKKVKKAVDTKLKKAAIAAAIGGGLTALVVGFDIPLDKNVIENLAHAISDAVVQIMDSPPEPPADAPTPENPQ